MKIGVQWQRFGMWACSWGVALLAVSMVCSTYAHFAQREVWGSVQASGVLLMAAMTGWALLALGLLCSLGGLIAATLSRNDDDE